VLIIVAWYAVRAWRRPGTRFLVVSLLLAAVLTLGTAIHVDGHRLGPAPWAIASHWRIVGNVLPERFAMYASLAAAVVVALWVGSTRGLIFRRPYLLPALAVAALVPAVWQLSFHERPERWPFFTDGLYKTCIPRNETLAIFPFARWGDSMLWQAESGFWFRMAEGNVGPDNLPANWVADPVVSELQFRFIDPNVRPSMRQLVGLVDRRHVDRVVSAEIHAYPDGTQMHAFGALQLTGGMLVAPACGYTSLTGDRRMVPAGQIDLGGRAALTALDDVERDLKRARVLLRRPGGRAAAAPPLARAARTLRLLSSYDRSAGTLGSAVALVAHGRLAAAERAVAAYRASIDPGVGA
jgi:hypothetical protein